MLYRKVFFFDPTYFLSLVPNNVLPSVNEDETQVICVEKCPATEVDVDDFYTDTGINLCRYGVDHHVDDSKQCPDTPVGAQ